MLAELDPKLAWYVARSSGWVAWGVCAAAVFGGLVLASRLVRGRGVPAWLLDLHRQLGVLALVFTAVHLLGLWADNWLVLGPAELFLPMQSPYRPGAVTVGVVALYLLVAVQTTSWLMRRIPRRWWHRVHLTSLPMLVLVTVHGFAAGSDTGVPLQWGAVTGAGVLLFLGTFRLLAERGAGRGRRRTAAPAR
jgi:DMSO/TMAO reductase YedYZ heme-binding membrane subunit